MTDAANADAIIARAEPALQPLLSEYAPAALAHYAAELRKAGGEQAISAALASAEAWRWLRFVEERVLPLPLPPAGGVHVADDRADLLLKRWLQCRPGWTSADAADVVIASADQADVGRLAGTLKPDAILAWRGENAPAELKTLSRQHEPGRAMTLLAAPAGPWPQHFGPRSTQLGLHHVGCLVRDMTPAVDYWLNFGCELVFGPVTDLRMDVRIAQLAQPGLPVLRELIEPYSPDSPIARRIGANRLDHLCIQVADLADEITRYEQAGARVTLGPLHAATFQRDEAFLIDPQGLLTQLLQADRSDQPWIV